MPPVCAAEPSPDCTPIAYRAIIVEEPTVTVLLALEQGDEFLLMPSVSNPEHFQVPGGKVRYGETPLVAIQRIMRQQLGISFSPTALSDPHTCHVKATHDVIIYRVHPNSINWKEIVRNGEPEECSELLWVNKYDLPVDHLREVLIPELHAVFSKEIAATEPRLDDGSWRVSADDPTPTESSASDED